MDVFFLTNKHYSIKHKLKPCSDIPPAIFIGTCLKNKSGSTINFLIVSTSKIRSFFRFDCAGNFICCTPFVKLANNINLPHCWLINATPSTNNGSELLSKAMKHCL